MFRTILTAASVAMLTACAASPAEQARSQAATERDQAKIDKALAGLSPSGETASCIQRSGIQTTKVAGDKMLFERSRNQVYVSDVGPGCRGSFDDILVFKSSNSSQYCRGDIVQTRDRSSGFFTGSCGLGDFTLYRRGDTPE